ncbi:MAG: substrate-binding domain-containing protein [Thiomonas sp.]
MTALGLVNLAHAQAPDVEALDAEAKKEGKVVMYTSVPTFLLSRWKTLFQAKYPGIDVEFFRSGTGKVLARVETESRAGSLGGDLVWLADPTTFNGMIAQNLLLSYEPPEWKHITLAKNPQGYFVAGRVLVGCLLTNPKAGGAAVKSFADLANPAMKGKICIASPLISGSTNIIDSALWKDPRFGWKHFEKLKKNEVLVLNDVPDVARAVASGERAAGISLSLYKYQPEFAKAPHPNAAKLFYRFLLSPVAQTVLSEAGIYPARTDLPAPNGLPDFA